MTLIYSFRTAICTTLSLAVLNWRGRVQMEVFVVGVWRGGRVKRVKGKKKKKWDHKKRWEVKSNLPTGGRAKSAHNPALCSTFRWEHTTWVDAVGPTPWRRGPDARLPRPWWRVDPLKKVSRNKRLEGRKVVFSRRVSAIGLPSDPSVHFEASKQQGSPGGRCSQHRAPRVKLDQQERGEVRLYEQRSSWEPSSGRRRMTRRRGRFNSWGASTLL